MKKFIYCFSIIILIPAILVTYLGGMGGLTGIMLTGIVVLPIPIAFLVAASRYKKKSPEKWPRYTLMTGCIIIFLFSLWYIYLAIEEYVSIYQRADAISTIIFMVVVAAVSAVVFLYLLKNKEKTESISEIKKKKVVPTAIISFVCGLMGGFLVGIIFALAAIVTGFIAVNKISKDKEGLGGEGMAIAGIGLGVLTTLFLVFALF